MLNAFNSLIEHFSANRKHKSRLNIFHKLNNTSWCISLVIWLFWIENFSYYGADNPFWPRLKLPWIVRTGKFRYPNGIKNFPIFTLNNMSRELFDQYERVLFFANSFSNISPEQYDSSSENAKVWKNIFGFVVIHRRHAV